jgi:hypothetical protein
MHTASSFAKKNGLERFLDRPGELNEMIFKLLVLQETMQAEQARRSAAAERGAASISVRRNVLGKFTARCSGDALYRYAVEMAIRNATTVIPLFQRRLFASTLRSMAVPEGNIAAYCDSVVLSDDTQCIDPE